MNWVCEACSKVIFGTSSDPLISTKGLGWKNYHYACASRLWRDRPDETSKSKKGEHQVMNPTEPKGACPAKRGKFLVQCTFIKDGMPTKRLSDFVNSLEEAEEYFNKQVRACPAGGGVDCTVLLVLKDGKHTQVDGHSFGIPASAGISESDEE